MIPYFVFDHFNLGSVRINVWGFFVGLAFAVGYFWILAQAKKFNPPALPAGSQTPLYKEGNTKSAPLVKGGEGRLQKAIVGLAFFIFIGAAIGSRLFFLLQNPGEFFKNISALWIWNQGGLMIWGGILGGILAGWIYVKFIFTPQPPFERGVKEVYAKKQFFWQIADIIAPALALGIGIGRLGCFLVNDHIGASTNLSWGILWPDGVARHPVALYESLAGLGLFAILLYLQNRRCRLKAAAPVIPAEEPGFMIMDSRFRGNDNSGKLFLLFLVLYSVLRFFLDFLRASDFQLSDPRWWNLTTSQWISVLVALICSFLYTKRESHFLK